MILATLRLYRQDELTTVGVERNVYLVNFDLPDAVHGRSQMTLHRVCGYAKKDIDQTVVSDFCEQCLLI